jgi:excisionase family DNA binding protein
MIKDNQGSQRTSMSVNQVANYFKVHPRTVRRWISRGNFPGGLRVGRITRFSTSAVMKWARYNGWTERYNQDDQ